MASNKAIATALGIFAETFPTREVTGQTASVWAAIMADVSDEALSRAVLRLCRDPERRFFPSSGEVFAAIAAEEPPADTLTILHRIEMLGHYVASVGWVYPTYRMVRDALGEEIAKAYVVSGAQTLFADDASEVSRNIAQRKFGQEVESVYRAAPNLLRLPAPMPNLMPEVEIPRERPPQFERLEKQKPIEGVVATVLSEIIAEQEVAA